MSDERKYFPVPEFIPGGKGAGWEIEDGTATGGAHMKPGVLHVPLNNACPLCGQPHARAIRAHELAHAEITLDKHGRMPVLPPGLKPEYFQVVEDARIWHHVDLSLCHELGTLWEEDYADDDDGPKRIIPGVLCENEREKWTAVYRGLDDKGRVLFACAAGSGDEAYVQDLVKNETPPNAKFDAKTIWQIRNGMRTLLEVGARKTPSILNTYKAATWLQRLLEDGNEDKDPDPRQGSDPQDTALADIRDEQNDSSSTRQANRQEASRNQQNWEQKRGQKPGRGIGNVEWAPMRIEEPPLARSLPGRLIARYNSADEGAFIRTPHRLYIDGKVFGKKHRMVGGAVLIDDSGSMSLHISEILEILEACPGALIASYATHFNPPKTFGRLRILAKDGKLVNDPRLARVPGGDNGIDGPALRWLARQNHPRKVWVSDGHVTGLITTRTRQFVGMHDSLTTECEAIRRKAHIIQVNPEIVGRKNMASATVNALMGRSLLTKGA